MEDILITGSRGFIGSAIRKCINQPYDELDLALGTNHKVAGRTGTLIYLSSWVKEDESFINPTKYLENNLIDLSFILSNNNFDKVIFPSSSAVYDEKGELEPTSVYGLTKLAGEKLVKIYSKKYWILRIANPCGSGDRRSVFYHLAQCKKNMEVFTLYKSNGLMKDFFDVSELSSIIKNIINNKLNSGIYNVGSGIGYNVYQLLKDICIANNIQYEVVTKPKGLSSGYIAKDNLIRVNPLDIENMWSQYL